MEIERELVLLGGEAANTAGALRAWGREVVLCGNRLGTGPAAHQLEALVARHGLSSHLLGTGGGKTPETDVYVTPDGERTMFGQGFSEMQSAVDPADVPYRPGEWFTADPNLDGPAREAARRAADAGMNLYLMDFIRPDDPIVPNSWWQSSTDWVGRRGDTQGNAAWLTDWIARHGCFGVLTDGAQTILVGGPGWPVMEIPTIPAPDVVDTTGAGDLFRAGMLYGLDTQWEPPQCLRFAAAAGSLACGSLGATSHVPTIEEIKQRMGP